MDIINTYIIGACVPLILMSSGIFYNFYLGFFYLRHPIRTLKIMFARSPGSEISPASALSLALAGTLGVGNIVGVASAIALGGAGSLFWMTVSALCAMVLKYAEITLALIYRKRDGNGEKHGGAMYYIRAFFLKIARPKTAYILACGFALLCFVDALSTGAVIQVNAISGSLYGVLGIPRWLCGIALALLCYIIICKGRKRILSVTDKLVPTMTLLYVVLSLAVMILRRELLGGVIANIVRSAFDISSVGGGIVGFLFCGGIRYGTMRGLLSNEAGCGTAPFAHASSDEARPAKQGLMGIAEVFVDTVLLCNMTGIVILLSYPEVAQYANIPIMMTLKAYSSVLGAWSEYFMCAAVLLFGFATVICWANYGEECARYLLGTRRGVGRGYVIIYSIAVFFGAIFAPEDTWLLADIAIGSMTLINVYVLLRMRREVMAETRNMIKRVEPL